MPEEPHGQRSLIVYSPQGHKESDTTEQLHLTHMKVGSETQPRRLINLLTSKSRNKRLKTTTKMLDVSFYLISGKNGWRLSRLIFALQGGCLWDLMWSLASLVMSVLQSLKCVHSTNLFLVPSIPVPELPLGIWWKSKAFVTCLHPPVFFALAFWMGLGASDDWGTTHFVQTWVLLNCLSDRVNTPKLVVLCFLAQTLSPLAEEF